MSKVASVAFVSAVLVAGLSSPVHASSPPATSESVAASSAHVVAAKKPPKTSWKSWKCGKAERYRSYGAYQCKRWVKYDYCGSSRPMRLVQKTKMSGLMWTRFYITPPNLGTDVDKMHKWKKSAKAKNRNMYVGQKGRYFYVQTPKKPQSKPVIRCEHP